ncbi:MFS transporter [Kosakonia radicincitans DSM 16656]|uniref:Major Facilitator Superfamily protein n=1 Tax=Kosakonia radicincitans TaxID=283686 RepID=A0AAX2EWW8_9ENTR|nr:MULTISPECIES: MFS transporter [Kosakonia]MDP9568617.1 MFS family permease [Kosakonia oryzae]ARD59784.1 MFS transporter [Kosakonia radicincitans DSM 16656]KDE34485.1 MFS transporter [Kosakonia radicincitans UMEnt01/12]MDD7997844.1 MFS transporter [Kosakonia radicincitans]NCF05164.1 MFS transporter [Kosakonia sp. MH5]
MKTSAVSPGRAGLILLLTGQMLPQIDTSITNVALDSITQSLHTSATQLALIVALYGVAFAVCLAMGSKLGDNFGRKRLFLAGVALFGLASLLCGLANSVSALLAARTLQGIGAALIVPQILATLHVTLKGTAHARAISLYGGIGGVSFIIGQMCGGWLVSADIAGLGWRNAFFINVPICLLILALNRYLPETRNDTRTRIDWQGTFALALILCCLLFPLALGPDLHWPWPTQAALLALFPLALWMRTSALQQQRAGLIPLVPPHLLKLHSVRFGLLIALLFFTAWSGFMFCMALTLQAGMGMTPYQSGNSFVALGIAYFVSAWYAPKLIARYSMRTILLTGLVIQVSGLLALIATLQLSGRMVGVLALAPSTALIGYGQALIVNSFYRIGMRDITTQDAGAGSALLSTLQQSTLGLGPAALGSVFLYLVGQSNGNYSTALSGFLVTEVVMMLVLAAAAVSARQQLAHRCPAS